MGQFGGEALCVLDFCYGFGVQFCDVVGPTAYCTAPKVTKVQLISSTTHRSLNGLKDLLFFPPFSVAKEADNRPNA